MVLTFWKSETAFRAWKESLEFKEGHARSSTLAKEAFWQSNKLETLTAILDSEAG